MPAPALSVVIPAYNQAATPRRTPAAREQQTLDPHLYEVIVVDDGSTDETAALVRGRSAEDPRVHLLQHGPNPGRSAAPHTSPSPTPPPAPGRTSWRIIGTRTAAASTRSSAAARWWTSPTAACRRSRRPWRLHRPTLRRPTPPPPGRH